MSVLTPINTVLCPSARAGLVAIWAVPCSEVVEVLIDPVLGMVSNVILTVGTEWTRLEFEPDTAYLIQEKLVAKGYTEYVKQTIYFEVHGLSNATRNALEDLNGNCCMNVIAEDLAGNFHYCGISERDGEASKDNMKTADGSSETGADPRTDVARYTETLACICDFYALITIDPNDFNPLFWTKPDEAYWTTPADEFWTIKGN